MMVLESLLKKNRQFLKTNCTYFVQIIVTDEPFNECVKYQVKYIIINQNEP